MDGDKSVKVSNTVTKQKSGGQSATSQTITKTKNGSKTMTKTIVTTTTTRTQIDSSGRRTTQVKKDVQTSSSNVSQNRYKRNNMQESSSLVEEKKQQQSNKTNADTSAKTSVSKQQIEVREPRIIKQKATKESRTIRENKTNERNLAFTQSESKLNVMRSGQKTGRKSMLITTEQQQMGPGTYNVENALDFTKPRRQSSPDMARQTERKTSERESVSPDQYNPNKESVLTQSPKWTIGVRRPEDLKAQGDSNMGPGTYNTYRSQFEKSEIKSQAKIVSTSTTSATKVRTKSALTSRGRAQNVANERYGRSTFEVSQIESHQDLPQFGKDVKGGQFGATKSNSSLSVTKRKTAATTQRRTIEQDVLTSSYRQEVGSEQVSQGLLSKNRSVSALTSRKEDTNQQQRRRQSELQQTETKTKISKNARNTVTVTTKSVKKSHNNKLNLIGGASVNQSEQQTRSRTRSALTRTTERHQVQRQSNMNSTADLGPGAYDGGKSFGKDVIGYSWGKPKPEKKIVDNRDYGYAAEAEFKQTRHRSPSAKIDKAGLARGSFVNKGQIDCPDSTKYKKGYEFGENVKGYSFGKSRVQKTEIDNRDYGYDSKREFNQTRHRSPNAIINPDSPARGKQVIQNSTAPGQYESHRNFGADTKTISFSRTARERTIKSTSGPGEYEIDRSVSQTKQRSRAAIISTEKRSSMFEQKERDSSTGPGAYESHRQFGKDNKKSFTIGKRSEQKIEMTAGPGTYELEKSSSMTRTKVTSTIISQEQRKSAFDRERDTGVSPGQYDDGIRFNSNSKSFKIGEKRVEKVRESAGPGTYSPERAETLTKTKSANIDLGKSPARPSSFAKSNDVDVAPGQYNHDKQFGADTKSFRIGEKRQTRIQQTAGPGTYDLTRAEQITKTKSVNINMGTSPARPGTFAQQNGMEVAPGQYDDGIRFNSNVKGFKIGERRDEKIKMTAGPGTYSPERAETVTKTRSVNIDLGKSPARPGTFAKSSDHEVGPGQYDNGKRFGEDTKSFQIGVKRETRIETTAGPGSYDHTRAESLTKTKMVNIDMGKSKARPGTFAKEGATDVSPGQYDDGIRFNSGVKGFKIGERREEKIEMTAGPGSYDYERADRQTRTKTVNIDMGTSPSRPGTFARANDTDIAPGQYDDGIRFNSGVKGFKIGEKRTEKVQMTAGPGTYSPERADKMTKTRTVNIDLGSSPARPGTFAKGGDVDVAPGQYDSGKRFGEDTKSFKIGVRRETRMERTAGPGTYDHVRAESLTRTKSATVHMGSSPARPGTFAKANDTDVAPGQYDDGLRFNSGVKGFKIGERREEKVKITAGPGTYSPERSEALTKTKSANINMGTSPSRPGTFAKTNDTDVAPGQYNDGIRFNSGVKGFKIGERREEKVQITAGPGTYSPERAETITKTRSANINMGTSPSRPGTFAKGGDTNVAPGQYDDGIRFNSGVKGFKIGEKREERVQVTAGPGTYSPERSEAITMTKSVNINMGTSPSRPGTFAKSNDTDVAPGQYDDGIRFNSGVKGFKIGERREEKIQETAGPGQYSPERGESQTKRKIHNIDLGRSPARPGTFAKGGDINVAPGQYDYGKRFGEDTKSFRIGEKRETRIELTAGPGSYSPERAERMTKTQTATVNMGTSPARPDSFAKGADISVAPGQYDDGIRFNSNVKGFKIGEKREEKIKISAGPGTYSPERAECLTKTRSANINMGTSPSRPSTFAKIDGNDVAPGQYNDGIRFNSNVKGFKIGERREEKVTISAGPGTYSPERAESLTKTRSANINMGTSPSRPGSFAQTGNIDVAPGQYDDGIRFNSNVKGFKIGERREERIQVTAGPGTYSPERAEKMTKTRAANIDLGSSPARPGSFAKINDNDVAPGQYDSGKKFGEDTKSFRIGEKREKRIEQTAGPGTYSPERAEKLTKTRAANIDMGTSPSRPGTFAKTNDTDVAPGQYDHWKKFGEDTKSFKIGEKREVRIIETAGPGSYDHTRAESLTRSKAPNINMGSSPARPGTFANTSQNDAAPGQYDDGIRFDSNVKSFTIGERRETRVEQTAGPGTYSPERAEKMTKTRASNIDLGSSPARPESFAKSKDVEVGPGQYDHGKKFGQDTKSFTIGEKRETKIQQTAGPGTYSPERADSLTKTRSANIDLGSSPSRPGTFAKSNDVDVAPGQYEDRRYEIGRTTKSFTIGERREIKIEQTAGPGSYDHTRADVLTKSNAPNINIGSSPSRPSTFANGSDVNVAPGQYEDRSYEFGKTTKSFTIGEKRETKIQQTVGPGTYSPELADSVTKTKMPNIDLGQSPARPGSFAKTSDVDVAPGQYSSGKGFGQDTKSFTIGERREKRVQQTAGPGSYDIERAERVTKTKTTTTINMASSPERPSSFARGEGDQAPGQYDDRNYEFGRNSKGFTIGERRETRIEQTAGPGSYSPERADQLTKTRSAKVDMGSSPSRPASFARGEGDQAPGQYDDRNYEFGKSSKGFTIGEKRETRIEQTVGPGEYNTERADKVTKTTGPNFSLGNSPSRPISVGQTAVSGTITQTQMVTKATREQRNSFSEAQQQRRTERQSMRQTRQVEAIQEKQDVVVEPVTTKKQKKMTAVSSQQQVETVKSLKPVKQWRLQNQTATKKSSLQQQQSQAVLTSTAKSGGQNKQVKTTTETIKQGNITKVITRTITTTTQQQVQKTQTATKSMKKSQSSTSFIRTKSAIKGSSSTAVKNVESRVQRVGRNTTIKASDERLGPGSFDIKGQNFGDNSKGFTMGVKREQRSEDSPGPGSYEARRSDSITKQRNPEAVSFDKMSGRKEASPNRDPSSELTSPERFYQYPKEVPVYTIGEKRPEKPKDGPGPGEYNLDDSATKPRTSGYHQF